MFQKLQNKLNTFIRIIEVVLALAVVFSVLVSVAMSVPEFIRADWTTNTAFYDLIYRSLLLAIGLELARMLITHDLRSVLELIAFVIARKTLKPDVTSTDIILIVTSFLFLMISKYILEYRHIKHEPK